MEPTQPGAKTSNLILLLQHATRPAVTIVFAVTISVMAILKIVDPGQYLQLVGMVMAFWFGAKGLSAEGTASSTTSTTTTTSVTPPPTPPPQPAS